MRRHDFPLACVQTNSVLAVIGVHDGEAHVNLSFRTEPAMFGIKFSF